MANVKPISPEELGKPKMIPDIVIEVFNTLIARNWDGSKAVVFREDVLNYIAMMTGMTKSAVLSNRWLDIEDVYSENYEVTFFNPDALDRFQAYFVFKKK